MSRLKKVGGVYEKINRHMGRWYCCYFNDMGYRCGYVSVTKPELAKMGVDPEDYMTNPFDVHWGITFLGWLGFLGPHPDDSDELFLGFDCAHCEDANDMEALHRYLPIASSLFSDSHGARLPDGICTIKTLGFVEGECISLVNQIEVFLESKE